MSAAAEQEERGVGAVVLDLGVPLGLDVLERGGRDDGIANQEDVGLRVRERAQTIVIYKGGASKRELAEDTISQSEPSWPAVSQRPRLIGFPSTITLAE